MKEKNQKNFIRVNIYGEHKTDHASEAAVHPSRLFSLGIRKSHVSGFRSRGSRLLRDVCATFCTGDAVLFLKEKNQKNFILVNIQGKRKTDRTAKAAVHPSCLFSRDLRKSHVRGFRSRGSRLLRDVCSTFCTGDAVLFLKEKNQKNFYTKSI